MLYIIKQIVSSQASTWDYNYGVGLVDCVSVSTQGLAQGDDTKHQWVAGMIVAGEIGTLCNYRVLLLTHQGYKQVYNSLINNLQVIEFCDGRSNMGDTRILLGPDCWHKGEG